MLKILLIDDEPKQAERGVRMLGDVFRIHSIEPEIAHFVGQAGVALNDSTFEIGTNKELMLKSIAKKALEFRPHIVFCDNKIAKYESMGQEVLAFLKKLLPETTTCLLTREALRIDQFGIHLPNPDFFVSKGASSGDEGYRRYIGSEILKLLRSADNFEIEWFTDFDLSLKKVKDESSNSPKIADVNSVVQQCLYDGSVRRMRKKVLTELLIGGRSNSMVFSCSISGEFQHRVIGVVKVSKKSEAEREYHNYKMYVKWVLPYLWKVEVLGFGVAASIGAVCYSFAFDGGGKPTSCTDLLMRGNTSVVDLVCESIFNPKSRTWYAELRETVFEASEYFQQPPFVTKPQQIVERESKFIAELQFLFGNAVSVTESTISLFGYTTVKPNIMLYTEDWGRVEECLGHGDLNAGNILVNSNLSQAAFIDFQNTGFHNIYRDFISFESSIRIDLISKEDITFDASLFVKELEVIHANDDALPDYLKQVKKVREVAFANFPICEKKPRQAQFLIASFVHFSWLLTRFGHEWSYLARKRLCIGAFASLHGLATMRRDA